MDEGLNTAALPVNDRYRYTTEDLWEADPDCRHEIYSPPGGGIRCRHCRGWFCY